MFDENGNYVLTGDEPQMSMAGTGGRGYVSQRRSKLRSFLDYFNQPQQGGQSGRPSIIGGLSQMAGQGGLAGGIGKFAKFLI